MRGMSRAVLVAIAIGALVDAAGCGGDELVERRRWRKFWRGRLGRRGRRAGRLGRRRLGRGSGRDLSGGSAGCGRDLRRHADVLLRGLRRQRPHGRELCERRVERRHRSVHRRVLPVADLSARRGLRDAARAARCWSSARRIRAAPARCRAAACSRAPAPAQLAGRWRPALRFSATRVRQACARDRRSIMMPAASHQRTVGISVALGVLAVGAVGMRERDGRRHGCLRRSRRRWRERPGWIGRRGRTWRHDRRGRVDGRYQRRCGIWWRDGHRRQRRDGRRRHGRLGIRRPRRRCGRGRRRRRGARRHDGWRRCGARRNHGCRRRRGTRRHDRSGGWGRRGTRRHDGWRRRAGGAVGTGGTGVCAILCTVGRTCCGGGCVNLQNDPFNCGKCATSARPPRRSATTGPAGGPRARRTSSASGPRPAAGTCAAASASSAARSRGRCRARRSVSRRQQIKRPARRAARPTAGAIATRRRPSRRSDTKEILDKVARLPISTWTYVEEPSAVRHLGPMAQDFHASFGLGSDDRTLQLRRRARRRAGRDPGAGTHGRGAGKAHREPRTRKPPARTTAAPERFATRRDTR